MNAAINQRGRHGPYHLPANWRAVEGNPGELLYVIRICDRYWCRREGDPGEWVAYAGADGPMSGTEIGRYALLDRALIACRDDMHANNTAA